MTITDTVESPAEQAQATRLIGALSALLVGVAGLVVGVGIGVRWLRAGVVSWKSVIGGLALVAGVFAFGYGVRRLGRGRSRGTRLAQRVIAVLAGGVLVWTLAPALIATNVPPLSRSAKPQDFGFEAAEVAFTTEDGVDIAAWHSPPANGAAVVVRHGSGSTASSVLAHAKVLVDHGYGVLITDARGHGNSGGEGMDFGWHGDRDIGAAVDYLAV